MNRYASMLAAAATLCLATPVMAQDDIIPKLLDKATEIFASKGYKPTGWTQRGTLAKGASKTVSVRLTGEGPFAIMGICDTDCDNADMVVTDTSGAEIASDVETDDTPIVQLEGPGTYMVRIEMKSCKTSSCDYGIRAFTQ